MSGKNEDTQPVRRISGSTLYEKRLGLYVLMGSILYILAVKNRHEKGGWTDTPYSWVLILFRAGPLGGMILMTPYMISNLKAQIESMCETLRLFHAKYQKKEPLAIALELFPDLEKQLSTMQAMRRDIVQGLFYNCIGESLSEISVQYAPKPSLLSQAIPVSASLLRSLGTYSFCKSLLSDSKKSKGSLHVFGATLTCILAALSYILGACAKDGGLFPGSARMTLSQSMVGGGGGHVGQSDLLKGCVHLELLVQAVLFSLCVVRRGSSMHASNASRVSPIVGSLLMVFSLVLRCFHLETKMVPHYVPYLEIGPYIWGLFVFIHCIAFYIRYEDGGDSKEGGDGGGLVGGSDSQKKVQ